MPASMPAPHLECGLHAVRFLHEAVTVLGGRQVKARELAIPRLVSCGVHATCGLPQALYAGRIHTAFCAERGTPVSYILLQELQLDLSSIQV